MAEPATAERRVRVERDTLGPMEVPADALYGASTQRAVLNFPISDWRLPRVFIRALGLLKRYAAEVNAELGLLDQTLAGAIVQAAQEVVDGVWDREFVVDVFQTGSGTSTNMNANEVIANRAAELLGEARGSKRVHPNDHVNLGQSSNDVIPSAVQLAALLEIREQLRPALQELHDSFRRKAEEFMPVVKTGRTHLMDATPIRLGQEFTGYAGHVEAALENLSVAEDRLRELPLGGTAVGTGTGRHLEFAERVCAKLTAALGFPVRETSNHFRAQSCLDAVVFTSGVLRTFATALMKVANDIRWMGSGPHAGLGELELPAVQPGSSIMPGKVNPVIPESVIQVCAQVQGNDLVVALGNQWGNFELNTMMPVMGYNLLQSIRLLANASRNFARQCVDGLKATPRGPEMVERGLMLATALAPVIGYDAAAEIAKEAARTGRTIRQVALERTQLSEEDLRRILDPSRMTEPGFTGGGARG